MISLFDGCYCSEPSVHPSNWKETGERAPSLDIDWYIQYRFYDPLVKDAAGKIKPKLCLVKGMNKFKTLGKRIAITKALLSDELQLLQVDGYNPITETFMAPQKQREGREEENEFDIDPNTPFYESLDRAFTILEAGKGIKESIKSMLNCVKLASDRLRYSVKPVQSIEMKHIKNLLAECGKVKKLQAAKGKKVSWSNCRYNMYRAYLKMLFVELREAGAIKVNPISDMRKKKEIKKIRTVLSDEERKKINDHLFSNCYEFWRYVQIFFHSGARSTELLQLKADDINLEKQIYKCIVYKGNVPREVERPIKDIVLHIWQELLQSASPGQYIFSKGLTAGDRPISPRQICRRWNRWVKKELGINVDFYPLKHLNTTETIDFLQGERSMKESQQLAARQNGHTTDAMVVKIYDVKKKQRENNELKGVRNKFA